MTWQESFWSLTNIVLLGLFIISLFLYIIQVNVTTSNNYKVRLLNDKISSLNEAHAALMASKLEIENLDLVSTFAKTNMVEATNTVAMFGESGVALRR